VCDVIGASSNCPAEPEDLFVLLARLLLEQETDGFRRWWKVGVVLFFLPVATNSSCHHQSPSSLRRRGSSNAKATRSSALPVQWCERWCAARPPPIVLITFVYASLLAMGCTRRLRLQTAQSVPFDITARTDVPADCLLLAD
jgi:hypothetical protein